MSQFGTSKPPLHPAFVAQLNRRRAVLAQARKDQITRRKQSLDSPRILGLGKGPAALARLETARRARQQMIDQYIIKPLNAAFHLYRTPGKKTHGGLWGRPTPPPDQPV